MLRNRWERATRISEGSDRDSGSVFRGCESSAVCRRHSRNAQSCRRSTKPVAMTIAEPGQHLQHRELARDDSWRSYFTRRNYKFYLRKWIIPQWENYELGEVLATEVESWLQVMERGSQYNSRWRFEPWLRAPTWRCPLPSDEVTLLDFDVRTAI
jgi:hypothetical protein